MSTEIFVCFLRGINVNGKNLIKMNDLLRLFNKSGFIEPTTYLQSGNVVFRSSAITGLDSIRDRIEAGIAEELHLKIPLMVRGGNSILELKGRNIFLNNENFAKEKLHVTMLDKIPDEDRVRALNVLDFTPEKFIISEADVFLYCPDGYGKAKLNNNYLEKKLGVTATTRNWKTIKSLQEIIKSNYSD